MKRWCGCFKSEASKKGGTTNILNSEDDEIAEPSSSGASLPTFSYDDLLMATHRSLLRDCLKRDLFCWGHIRSIGQLVYMKPLDESKSLGNEEFVAEAQALSLLDHPNIAKVIGCCADERHRFLLSEYMPVVGSLDEHLHDSKKYPLDWNTRIKIAIGVAKGLEYLHCEANPPIIYGELKASNILLGEGFHPKLTDFGLSRLLTKPDESHDSHLRIRDINSAYLAPEYAMTGSASLQSDVYSFGVLLLEIISGQRPIKGYESPQDRYRWPNTVSLQEARENLNAKAHVTLADPRLPFNYPELGLSRVLTLAFACFQEDADDRPDMEDVVTVLNFISLPCFGPYTPRRPRNDPYHKDEFGKVFKDMIQRRQKVESPMEEEKAEKAPMEEAESSKNEEQ